MSKTGIQTDKPHISVVMAVHDGAAFLRPAIESILNQTYRNFEFIVIDDGSTDETANILTDFAQRDRRLLVKTNHTNLGLPRSLNIGLEAARGAYIARMDDDDVCLPHRFADQVRYLENNPECVVVGAGAEFVDADGRRLSVHDRGLKPWEFAWASLFRAPLLHSAAMIRADTVRQHGLRYDPSFDRAEDFEFWHRLLLHGEGCELPGNYMQCRRHAAGVSSRFAVEQQHAAANAMQLNIKRRFPNGLDTLALCEYLHPSSNNDPVRFAEAVRCIECLQSAFSKQHQLTIRQQGDIGQITAKLLLRKAAQRGLLLDSVVLPELFGFVVSHAPDIARAGGGALANAISRARPADKRAAA